jgi:hypothetical protein
MFGANSAPEARAHPLFPGGPLVAENLARMYYDLPRIRKLAAADAAQRGRPTNAPDADEGTAARPGAYRRPNKELEEERKAAEAQAQAQRAEAARRKAIADERRRQREAEGGTDGEDAKAAPPAAGSKAAQKLAKKLKAEDKRRHEAEEERAREEKQAAKRAHRRVPRYWLESGTGWVTQFFSDLEPFDAAKEQPGVHRCEVPQGNGVPCSFVVTGGESAWSTWEPKALAPEAMLEHLLQAHPDAVQLQPRKRRWVTGADGKKPSAGFWDAVCCGPCQMQRQVAAFHGYSNSSTSKWDCLPFCFCCPCRAYSLRKAAVGVHNIDENGCVTCLYAMVCCPCSISDVYSELSADDLWPGGECERMAPLGLMYEEVRDDEPGCFDRWFPCGKKKKQQASSGGGGMR